MLKNKTEKEKAYIFLIIGITAMASASLIIRLTSAPPIIIASYRLLIASLILLLLNRKTLKLPKNLPILLIAGLSLGMHFYSWISSLFLTTVANAVVLVNTSPIFISLLSYIFEKKKPTRSFFLSLFFILLGIVLITNNKISLKFGKGELLAILGAITFAIYLYMGRYLSPNLSVSSYITLVYFTGGIILLVFAILTKTPLIVYPLKIYFNVFLLALIPQLIGHTSANYAIRILSPNATSIILIGETVIATLLALVFLKEKITLLQTLGMLLIIIGIIYSSLKEK
ncbi:MULTISPECIES: DMT family transporter [Dictyoglomus]|jgi:drug/metabolite transporter (DMT)-like permease|uniref:DMT family transporter n=1 Tax=Dictyoglomus TaxID=13 RepID=UPI000CCDE21E|nr:MAG: EamA family transporter [Dictyoglomus turgidum]